MNRQVIGRYRVEGVIGSGGFGTVYRALDPVAGGRVAIKVLDRSASDAVVLRLRAEAEAMLQVDDPHCVQVLEVINDPPLAAIVSQYIDGASVRAVVQRNGRLDGQQSLHVLRGALLGLAAVHRAGLVHGDVKPDNILLDRSGTSRLIDFGLAGPATRPRSGSVLGSPGYMSPEQVRGDPLDARSDIYACAAVLFELLTGHRPYTGASIEELLDQHLHAAVPGPRAESPTISDDLAAVCTKGLAKNPDDRFQSADEFRAALERAARRRYGDVWLAGAGLGAAVGAVLDRPTHSRVRRRLPRRALVALGAVLTVGIAAVVLISLLHSPTRHPLAATSRQPAAPTPSAGKTLTAGAITNGAQTFRHPAPIASLTYNSVSCPTSTTCLASGQSSSRQPVLSVSTDAGASWHTTTLSAPAPLGLLSCSSVTTCVAEYFDGAIHMVRTADAGVTWRPAVTPHLTNLQSVSCPTADSCLAVGGSSSQRSGQAIRTTDGGHTWQAVGIPAPANSVSCPDSSHCWASSAVGKVWSSGDLGGTWRDVSAPDWFPNEENPLGPYPAGAPPPRGTGRFLALGFDVAGVAFTDDTHGIAFGGARCGGQTTQCSGGVWRTADAGATWTFWNRAYSSRFPYATYAACVGPACLVVTSTFRASAVIATRDAAVWASRQTFPQFAGRVTCSRDGGVCVVIGQSGLWAASS